MVKFENDGDILPVVASQPVGLYSDIFYNGFIGTANGIAPVAGIRPQSPNKFIAYSLLAFATIVQGQPAMNAAYPDSTIEYFDLKSFYFGTVVAAEQSAAAVPATATVTAECFNTAGKSVKKQTFTFKSNGGLVQDMIIAKMNHDAQASRDMHPNPFQWCSKLTIVSLLASKAVKGSSSRLRPPIRCFNHL